MCVITTSTNPLPLEISESLQERESHLQSVWWGCWKCDRDRLDVPSVSGALLLYHRSDRPIIPQTSRLVGSEQAMALLCVSVSLPVNVLLPLLGTCFQIYW